MAANPLAALNMINPSLIGYMGGAGKGVASFGNALSGIGKAQLDLEQQDRENKSKQAYFDLQKTMYDQGQKDKFEAKNEKLASNATTNAMLMGIDAPQEMSTEYARLSMIDPTITAAAVKRADPEFGATDGGLIYNKRTGQMVNDYRTDKDGAGFKGAPSVDTMVNGVLTRNFIMGDGSVKSVPIRGTALPIAYQANADALGDQNVPQRLELKDDATEEVSAKSVVQRGNLPIRLNDNPKIAAKQREFALPAPGGGWYVPAALVQSYSKTFLAPPPPLKKGK